MDRFLKASLVINYYCNKSFTIYFMYLCYAFTKLSRLLSGFHVLSLSFKRARLFTFTKQSIKMLLVKYWIEENLST